MGALEQVIKLREKGLQNSEIVNNLMQSGVSPKEIQEALKQADIKKAVSGFKSEAEMQPSIMNEDSPEIPSPNTEYSPNEEYPQEQQYYPQEGAYSQEQQYYSQEQYPPQEGAYSDYSGTSNPDMIIEIANQVFTDKIKKLQNQTENNAENIILLQTKFENLSERLKKIENIIDKLQIAILEKVGSYGQNLEAVKKEMSMMQESFSKMVSSK